MRMKDLKGYYYIHMEIYQEKLQYYKNHNDIEMASHYEGKIVGLNSYCESIGVISTEKYNEVIDELFE